MKTITPRWMQRSATVGTILLLAVMLTACIEATSSSAIGTDLKGTTAMRVGFSKDTIQLLSSFASSTGTPTPMMAVPTTMDIFGDLIKQVMAMGGTATPFDDGQFVGVDISFPFNSLDEMQRQINTVLGDSPMMGMMGPPGMMGASGSMGAPGGMPGSGALAQITAKQNGDTIRIDGTVDPLSSANDMSAMMAGMGGMSGLPPGLDASALLAGGKVELSFTMPGAINSTDALATQDGMTASWSFKLGDPKATIFVESASK